ncbi:MAG: thymidine kinase [Erythrobacter sp.]|nr:thymidine kinase [Erythrobacter sp.]
MAKLYFYYASMNAGKSTTMLQADFNYRERGMRTMLWTAELDTRSEGTVRSRIGLEAGAHLYAPETELWNEVYAAHNTEPLDCVLVDEAQFLTKAQVWQLARLADEAGIPVLCYGIRTDFQGELFPGSAALLGIADTLVELKAVCHCGRKASMNLRVDSKGKPIKQGEQTEIGGNDRYLALCRKHFSEALSG